MERKPLTRQRSSWDEFDHVPEIEGVACRWYRRNVHDGSLTACVADEPQGWHMSISFRNHRGEHTRYPHWDEIAYARDEMLPPDVDFVMWLPKTGDYVAFHDTAFHLHQHPPRRGTGVEDD